MSRRLLLGFIAYIVRIPLTLPPPHTENRVSLRCVFQFLAFFLFFDLQPPPALTAAAIEIQMPFEWQFALGLAVCRVFSVGAHPPVAGLENDVCVYAKGAPAQTMYLIRRQLQDHSGVAEGWVLLFWSVVISISSTARRIYQEDLDLLNKICPRGSHEEFPVVCVFRVLRVWFDQAVSIANV